MLMSPKIRWTNKEHAILSLIVNVGKHASRSRIIEIAHWVFNSSKDYRVFPRTKLAISSMIDREESYVVINRAVNMIGLV